MSKVYLTGDHHFDQEGMIQVENRPFDNVRHQKSELIRLHNELVNEEDIVYFLGDLCMGGPEAKTDIKEFVSSLNGHKHLILGNHDILKPFDYIEIGFHSVHTSLPLSIRSIGPEMYEMNSNLHCHPDIIYLNHDPAPSIIAKDNLWICAHVHSLFRRVKNVVNVGVDVRGFKPMLIEHALSEFVIITDHIA